MENTAWAIEGGSELGSNVFVELQGRRFAAVDGGAPQLCSSVCSNLGRHAHIDYCNNIEGRCQEPESEHIHTAMLPQPHRPKDWVSHKAFWAKTGFKDPYSKDYQTEFSKCEAQCSGPEHEESEEGPARPSYCTLPIFHPPHPRGWTIDGTSHISGDGHSFACLDPTILRPAFHVIFVSSSMGHDDRKPVPNTPCSAEISRYNPNRFGAVLSALYGFWLSRDSGTGGPRRNSYSAILFSGTTQVSISNDVSSTPDELLRTIVSIRPEFGTDFDNALLATQSVMETHWSGDKYPIVIFLSDGECRMSEDLVFSLCRSASSRQKPLSFHAVSFGNERRSRSLRRMVDIAAQVMRDSPRDLQTPLVPCEYTDAIDTIRLAETFLYIAESLKKPRAHLIRS
ncbi:hypothetical protein FRB95_002446 [Tulasnella sp. JGI-2019a]|nr:hypothetical protein FRB95_002446 [Tulasnella sp. JGI-2019a]